MTPNVNFNLALYINLSPNKFGIIDANVRLDINHLVFMKNNIYFFTKLLKFWLMYLEYFVRNFYALIDYPFSVVYELVSYIFYSHKDYKCIDFMPGFFYFIDLRNTVKTVSGRYIKNALK